jgi:transcriptional regulator with XRE-family HTH domain
MGLSHVTADDLADALGVSPSAVYAWMNGTNLPRHRRADGICSALGTDRRKYAQMGGFDG